MIVLVTAATAAARKSIFRPSVSGWGGERLKKDKKGETDQLFVDAVVSTCALSITAKAALGSWRDGFDALSRRWGKHFIDV